MEISYWLSKWRKGQIGFHLNHPHHSLDAYFKSLIFPGAKVLVPLCGKTPDLLWLRSHGAEVTGVEISEIAVVDFFEEHNLNPKIREQSGFTFYAADGLQIITGDYFKAKSLFNEKFDIIYDRAALVAMPPQKREQYATNSAELLSQNGVIALVSFSYNQHVMNGPPFSVPKLEIAELYPDFDHTEVWSKDILPELVKFRERGLQKMEEKGYILKKK